MDDVDFTVLAATSVLGDLMEKCPPAEACRDAFDRMSKATISMCMKTTGFGPQALRHLPPKVQEPTMARSNVRSIQRGQDAASLIDPSLQQQSHRHRRPPPRFDMDLKALFSDDEQFKRQSTAQQGTAQLSAISQPIKQETTSMFPNRSTMAPPIVHQHSLHRAQQTPPGAYGPSPPIDPSLRMTPPMPRQSPTHQQNNYFANLPQPYANTPQGTDNSGYTSSNFDSLDFLDGFNMNSNGGDGSGGGLQGAGLDSSGSFADYDLGFGVGGLAFDGGAGPSWDENGGFDLFGGFFFGGGAASGGGGL